MMQKRLYFLDNLRTVLIFLVVLIHAGIVYEPILESTWIVTDPAKSSGIGIIRMYMDLFVMFIMFFISGYFIPTSIKNNTSQEFVISKIKRIIVPWAIAVLTLIPAYKVIFLYSRGLPQAEWFTYFHFFKSNSGNFSFFADYPNQSWLWFLPVLFIFQVVYLGILKTKLLSISISLKNAVILLFIVGIAYSMIISLTQLTGWFNSVVLHFQRERLLIYFMSFLLGSLCYKLKIFESFQKNKKHYIIANVLISVSITIYTLVALNLFFNMVSPDRNYFFISSTVDRVIYYASGILTMLNFLYILIYVFRFSFNKEYKLLGRLNMYSYSVYIIHIVIMGLIALVLLNLQMPALLKYGLLTVTTLAISNLIVFAYKELLVGRTILKVAGTGVALIAMLIMINQNNTDPKADKSNIVQTSQSTMDIHEAIITDELDAMMNLLSNGVSPDEKDQYSGSTPLITASVFGKKQAVEILIKHGANIDMQNNDGSSALHSAAFFCRTDIVEALLKNGADKSLKNKSGATALESVDVDFEVVKPVYDYFANSLGQMGLKVDYEYIEATRPRIVEMLIE